MTTRFLLDTNALSQLLESGVDTLYAEIRHGLESRGTPMGPNDLLIAVHALDQSETRATDNVAESQRVSGLNLDNRVRPV